MLLMLEQGETGESFTSFSILTQWDRNNAMFWFNFLSWGLLPGYTEAVQCRALLLQEYVQWVALVKDMNCFHLSCFGLFVCFLLEGLKIQPVLFPILDHSSKLIILIPKTIPPKGKAGCGPLSQGSTGCFFPLCQELSKDSFTVSPHDYTWRNKILISASLKPLPCRDEQNL